MSRESPPPRERSGGRNRSWLGAAIAAVLTLHLGRSWTLLAAPRFWAEEGAVYFAFAFREGFWASLVAPQLGYFSLLPNLGAALALLVPLGSAPCVTTLLALAVQWLTSALAFVVSSRLWDSPARRLAVAAAIPLLAPAEVWLTTIAAQFWLCIATFLVLQDEGAVTASRLRVWGLRMVLAAGGLTGAASCFLAPFFVWQARRSGRREHRVRALVLVAACLLQLAVFAAATAERNAHLAERFATSDLSVLELLAEHVARPIVGIEFLGWKWVQRLDLSFRAALPSAFAPAPGTLPRLSLLVVLVFASGAIAALAASGLRRLESRPRWLAWLAVIVLSTAASIHFAGSPRYAFAPNVFLAICLIDEARAGRPAWRRRTAAALLAAALASNIAGYRSRIYQSPLLPRWSDELARWRRAPDYRPKIWPQSPEKSWLVELRREG